LVAQLDAGFNLPRHLRPDRRPWGVVAFLVVYLAAIDSAGWVIGIALGWIPAFFAAATAFFIGRHLWWTLPFLISYALRTFG
jgi:hypothetical protein